MKDYEDSEIIGMIRGALDDAIQYADDLGDEREQYYQLYRAQPYGNEIEGWASVVDPVIWNAIEGMMPSLVEIFNDDWFQLLSDDKQRADDFKEVIRYQMYRKQDGYKVLISFIRDTLLYFYGVMKVYHAEEYYTEDRTFDLLTEDQFSMVSDMPEITVSKYDEVTGTDDLGNDFRYFENVKLIKREVKYRGPVMECIPPWEFGFSPGYKDIDDCPLVYHKVRRSLSYIRQKEDDGDYREGSYAKLRDRFLSPMDDEELEYNLTTSEIDDSALNQRSTEPELEPAQEVDVFECYCKLDIDGDGILEDVILTISEDVVLNMEVNPYRRPPFRLGVAYPEGHKIPGIPLAEILKEDQKTMTNLKRLVQDAAAQATYQNPVTDDPNMYNLLLTRRPMSPLLGNPNRVKTLEIKPPQEFVLKAIEMEQGDIEGKTGVTKYNQGLDSDSLNKTARGVTMIMTAAQQRLKLVARTLGNTALKGIIRDFIFINQKWPGDDVIRVIGNGLEVHPDDLMGEYDIKIDVGVGPQEKQQAAMLLDQLVQFQLSAGIKMGLATPVEVRDTLIRKYKLLGMDIDELLIDPAQQQGGMNGQAGQPGIAGPVAGGGVSPEGIEAGQPGQAAAAGRVSANMLQRGNPAAEQPDIRVVGA